MTYPLIQHIERFDGLILADGEAPHHSEPLRLLSAAPFVCCCDGAALRYPQADAIVGDGDSLPAAIQREVSDKSHWESEQDDNDLTKATRYCLSKGLHSLVYLGATGRREDHTLGNISLMVRYYHELGVEPLLATNYGWFVVAEGESTFESFPRQQVSIFNFGCNRLSSEGLKWQSYAYPSWWQGTLNEAVAHSFSLNGNGLYLVFRTYEAKKQ